MTLHSAAKRFGIVARRRPSSPALIAGAAGLGLAMSPAMALAAEAAVSQLEGVTVTAAASARIKTLTKLAMQLRDIPQSITVIDRTMLQAQGVSSLSDALRNVPGITIAGAEGGQIGNNINLNGFSARTDIYMNGFRDRGQYYRDTFALENVEVLMGPSSMLFGRGSTGGAINQVSKQAALKPATEFIVSGTSNGLARGTADFNATLGDTAAFRVSIMGQQGAPGTRKQTTVKDYGVSPVYAWGIGTPTTFTVSGLAQHNNDRPDYGVVGLNLAPVQSGANTVYGYSDDRTVQDVRAISGQLKHRFASGVTLRNQVQYNSVDTDARETSPQTIGTVNAKGFTALTPTGVSNLPLDQLFVRMQSHDRVVHDASLFNQAEASGETMTGSMKHSLLAGVEVGHDTYANQNSYRNGACNGVALGGTSGYIACVPVLNPGYTTAPIISPIYSNLAGGKADTQAVYINDSLEVTPQLKLVGGVRYDRYAATITNSINSANTPGNTAFASLSQTVSYTSVRAGAIWQPSKSQSYYASYSTSFNPSLEQLVTTTGITRPLPPESNRAYEVGAKWDLIRNLGLSAAAFEITKDNARSQNADSTYSPNGTIQVRGIRFGAQGLLARGWQVYGGYTHLDAKIVSAIAVGTQGKTPLNTPRDSATVWTTYELGHHVQIGGGAIYLSQRYLTNLDTIQVPGYTRFDATIAWRRPKYDIRLNLTNLTDAKFYDNLQQSDGGRAVAGAGRTAMITVVYRP